MGKKKTQQQVTVTPEMQNYFNSFANISGQQNNAPVPNQYNISREEINKIYNETPTVNKEGLTREDIDRIYNSTSNEIPTLNPISKNPSLDELKSLPNALDEKEVYKHDYSNAIKELQNQLADTNAQRTEGETKAIEDYMTGLQGLQTEVNRYNRANMPKTTSYKTKKEETKVDSREKAKQIGREALQKAQNGSLASKGYSLSPNEQRDLERANTAIQQAKKKEISKLVTYAKGEKDKQNFNNLVNASNSGKTVAIVDGQEKTVPISTLNENGEYDKSKDFERGKSNKFSAARTLANYDPSDEAFIQKTLDPNYKMSKKDKQRAEEIYNKFEETDVNENAYTTVYDPTIDDVRTVPTYTVVDGKYDPSLERTEEQKQQAQDIYAMHEKATGKDAALYGAMEVTPGVKAFQNFANDEATNRAIANAKKQNPGKYFGGMIGSGIAYNMAGQGMLQGTKYADKIGKLMGANGLVTSAGKKIVGDALLDAPVDLATDIIPNLAADIAKGEDADTVLKNLAINTGLNAGLNLGASTLGNLDEIPELYNATKGKVKNVVNELNGTNAQNRFIDSILANTDDVNIPKLNNSSADDMLRNAGLDDYIMGDEGATTVYSMLHPKTNAEIDKMLNNPQLRQMFENEFGVKLSGSNAEQRRMVRDLVESQQTNDYIDSIIKNTDELSPLQNTNNINPDDATEMFRNAQLGLNEQPVEEVAKPTVQDLMKKMGYVDDFDDEVEGAVEQTYRTKGNGQMTFMNTNNSKQLPSQPKVSNVDTPQGTLNNKEIDEVLNAPKQVNNPTPEVVKQKTPKAQGKDISDEAKKIYEEQYISQWDNMLNDKDSYKQTFKDYIKKFDIDDTGIEGAEADRIVDAYTEAAERLVTAKDYKAATRAAADLHSVLMDLNDLLEGRSITETVADDITKNAYDTVINSLKGKTLYINPTIKAEFPDGAFALNKFGSNLRFTTDPKKGVALDSLPDVKESLRGIVDIENDSDIDAQKKIVDFLLNNKGEKTITREYPYDMNYVFGLGDDVNDIYNQKLSQLGYAKGGKELGISKAYTNTGTKQGASDVEYAKNFNVNDFRYEKTSDEESMKEALKYVSNTSDENVINKLDNTANWTHKDLDSAMLLHRKYIQEAKALDEAGQDSTEAWKNASKMFQRVQRQASNDAQVLQALAKWNKNTPEGQLAHTLATIRNKVDSRYSKGYSSAIDYVGEKIDDILKSNLSNKEKAEQIDNLLSYNLQFFANEVGINTVSKGKIKGKNAIKNAVMKGGYTDDEIVKQFKKYNDVASITAKDEAEIYKLLEEATMYEEGSREWKVNRAKAMKIFQRSMPSSAGEKVKTILYDNMLASLKTTITRNFGSNVIYNTLEDSTKWEKALIDRGVSLATKRRSHVSTVNSAIEGAKGLGSGARDTFADFFGGYHTTRSGEESLEHALNAADEAFKMNNKSKVANAIESVFYGYDKLVGAAMELGDRPIYEKTYRATKAELEALVKKYGDEGLRAGTDATKTGMLSTDDLIKLYCREEALKSVMQNKSSFTQSLVDLKKALSNMTEGVTGNSEIVTQATMPFTQVPGNMLDRMIEYTPGLGMVRNGVRSAKELKKYGQINQRRFVDELTHQINGSALAYGSYGLAKNNMISDAYSDDTDKRKAQQYNDYQEYALQNVPWLEEGEQQDFSDVPIVGPMLQYGKEIDKSIQENNPYIYDEEGNVIGIDKSNMALALAKGGLAGLEGVSKDTLFQGLNRITGADNQYSSSDGFITNGAKAVMGSANQLVPSFVRQTAQFKDPYKRDLGDYGTSEYYANLFNNSLPGNWEASNNPLLSEIPVVKNLKGREALPVKIDTAGQNVLQGTGVPSLEKAYETYLAPYKTSTSHYTETFNEAERLEGQLGDLGAYTPQITQSELTKVPGYDAENYSHEDLYNMRKDYSQMVEEGKKEIYNTDFYKNLSDEEKLQVNKDLNSAYKVLAKKNVPGSEYESNDKLAKAIEGGTNKVLEYYKDKQHEAEASDIGLSVTKYDNANSVFGNNQKQVEGYSNWSNKYKDSDMSTRITSLENTGMSMADKGKYMAAEYGDYTDESTKAGQAFKQGGYETYYMQKKLNSTKGVTDYNGDGKKNTYDYIQFAYTMGYSGNQAKNYANMLYEINKKK